MAQKQSVIGGDGTSVAGQTKRDVQGIRTQWQAINDDLTTNWNSLDNAGKIVALRAGAVFDHKVLKYLLIIEFGE